MAISVGMLNPPDPSLDLVVVVPDLLDAFLFNVFRFVCGCRADFRRFVRRLLLRRLLPLWLVFVVSLWVLDLTASSVRCLDEHAPILMAGANTE